MAEVDKILSCGGQVLSDEGDGVPDVGSDCGDIGTLVANRLYTLPWDLGGGESYVRFM